MLIVRTPLRISLLGGGTDLPEYYKKNEYGAVLSFAINKYIYLSIHPLIEDNSILLKYSKQEYVKEAGHLAHPVAREILKEYDVTGVDISVSSDIPAGTGMGSSSCFTVGFYNLIENYIGNRPDIYKLAELACDLEINKIGEPIGKQDQYACALGNINSIYFYSDEKVYAHNLNISEEAMDTLNKSILLIRTGGIRSAGKLLKLQNETINNSYPEIIESYNWLKTAVPQGVEYLKSENFQELGKLINIGWEHKKSFSESISHQEIDELIKYCLAQGAYGAKLLGAGSSGYVFILAHEIVINELERKFGTRTIRPLIEKSGSRVIYKSE